MSGIFHCEGCCIVDGIAMPLSIILLSYLYNFDKVHRLIEVFNLNNSTRLQAWVDGINILIDDTYLAVGSSLNNLQP